MARMLLISILVALVALPSIAAREKNHTRALKKAVFLFVAFNILYLFSIRYLYIRLL
jgi:hypothetical protein